MAHVHRHTWVYTGWKTQVWGYPHRGRAPYAAPAGSQQGRTCRKPRCWGHTGTEPSPLEPRRPGTPSYEPRCPAHPVPRTHALPNQTPGILDTPTPPTSDTIHGTCPCVSGTHFYQWSCSLAAGQGPSPPPLPQQAPTGAGKVGGGTPSLRAEDTILLSAPAPLTLSPNSFPEL